MAELADDWEEVMMAAATVMDVTAADGGADYENPYEVLHGETIRKLLEHNITEVSSILRVSRGIACTLLLNGNWIPDSVIDRWFDGEGKNGKPVKQNSSENHCKICFETVEVMASTTCGHLFCIDCWKTYITTSIDDGHGCLDLACPDPACESAAGLDMVDSLAARDVRDKYYKYLDRSYVERCGKKRKWCPGPGCDAAIEFHGGGESGCYSVRCDCYYKFCWKCTAESHRPVDCSTAAEWLGKVRLEAKNIVWILNNTKACPKCHRQIEKSSGCHHMTCPSPCNYHFCWVCLEPIKDHRLHSSCYNKSEEEGGGSRYQINRMNVEKDFDKFTLCYEKWDHHEKLRKMGMVELERAKNEHIYTLARVQGDAPSQMQCVVGSWETIVECRSLIKWTNLYGCYLSLGENTRKKSFFEFLQGEAEAVVDRLQHSIEVEMKRYLEMPCEDFNDFRLKLINLNLVTGNYIENFVRILENNLSEVDSDSEA